MAKKNIKLYDSVSIFFNSDDEIRFRKGIWNFEEASLTLNDLEDNMREVVMFIVKELLDDKLISFDDIVKKFSLNEKDSNLLNDIINSLIGNRFLEYDDKKNNMLNTVYCTFNLTICIFRIQRVLDVSRVFFKCGYRYF